MQRPGTVNKISHFPHETISEINLEVHRLRENSHISCHRKPKPHQSSEKEYLTAVDGNNCPENMHQDIDIYYRQVMFSHLP